jgi:hypothetical protein
VLLGLPGGGVDVAVGSPGVGSPAAGLPGVGVADVGVVAGAEFACPGLGVRV